MEELDLKESSAYCGKEEQMSVNYSCMGSLISTVNPGYSKASPEGSFRRWQRLGSGEKGRGRGSDKGPTRVARVPQSAKEAIREAQF
jgi:hypothetical protein